MRVRAAIAFVTCGGVDELSRMLVRKEVSLTLTARAADATDPEALARLRDEVGAEVSVVIGKHAQGFHPKLWLMEGEEELIVLSGSGNLTRTGLTTNDEQFEIRRFPLGSEDAVAQNERLGRLTRNSLPLEQVEGTPVWDRWMQVREAQAPLRSQISMAERELNEWTPNLGRAEDKRRLAEDLESLCQAIIEADLPDAAGRRYRPTRLLQAVKRARDGEREPVKLVADTISKRTGGFDILRAAGLVELTLEWLVLDESKSYYDLFGPGSLQKARERIAEFERDGVPLPELEGDDGFGFAPAPMSVKEIAKWFEQRLIGHPDGYELPLLHRAQARLLSIEGDRAVVRRASGTVARPYLRVLSLRLRQMALGQQFRQSDLRVGTMQDSATLGPLLADLPGVEFVGGLFRLKELGGGERAEGPA